MNNIYTIMFGVGLFSQDSMLLPFMRFYEAFSIHMDFEAAGTQLSYFVVQHKSVCICIYSIF